MSLPTNPLGKGGPDVNVLGFGLMGLSGFYGPTKPEEERMAILSHAYDIGERFWDSADIYMDSEDLVGRWFKANPGKRDNVFLATKFANLVNKDGTRSVRSDPEYVKEACEKSLGRLGIPSIDLYYCHRLDKKTPIEKTVQAMKELKDEGKIKYLGLSECSAESLRRACKVHHIAAVQIEYSPFSLDIEQETIGLLKACRELGVGVVAYSPIGRGLITGELKSHDDLPEDDFRRNSPRFSKENFPKNLELVDKIKSIAERKGVTPSQLTLAWLIAQGNDIFPIPGTTRISRLDENVAALKVNLTKEEETQIRELCEKAEVRGDRYAAAMMPYLFADTPALTA